MFVSGSTRCFEHLSLEEAIEKLGDLEYTSIEIGLTEDGNHIKPSEVAADLNAAVEKCIGTHRLNLVSFYADIQAQGEEYFEQFDAICRLSKATKVVTITVPSGELGTPFNEEVEKFKRLVAIAENQGVRVGMLSMTGHISEDPDTVGVICDHVKGLALSFDPSHYIYQRPNPPNTEKLIKYIHQVYLRDTTKDDLQIKVGQGLVDYGKIVNQLVKVKYNRALTVHIWPDDQSDHFAELRKIRLLLESLLM